MTYEEIVAEVALFQKIKVESPHARAVFGAFMQCTSGLAIKERCPYCKGLLFVTNLNDRAWTVSCPCGRSSDTLRGL